ncbi:MAG: rRNA pseudouridine synthase [Oscillospiraceae bacterium]|nr:rRNA pseudouridine synthase [Oscillospiraceae bacterium]
MMPARIQKIIADSGLMSRRAAEEAIRQGRVVCDGRTVSIGECAEEDSLILVDGVPISAREEKRYYMLNKPRGYVCTMHDERGRKSVRELIPEDAGRVYPVGRLDMMSEGLLLMTNDGDFALRVTHPSGMLLKTYRTTVRGEDLKAGIRRLRESFDLDGRTVCAVQVTVLKSDDSRAVIDICIREGRNRQIRRMCEQAELKVLRLIRVAEGPLQLGKLAAGKARPLTAEEISAVMEE